MTHPTLSMWTVYDRPRDFPDRYVARRWEIGGGATREPVATDDVIQSIELAYIRAALELKGLTPIARSQGDDERIVETWL